MRLVGSTSYPRVRRRQVALFVASVLVPSVAFVAVGWLTMAQQDELADKHASDERRLRTADLERALVARLEPLRQETADPAVALTARLVNAELRLPWEERHTGAPSDLRVRTAISEAEHAEFVAHQLESAERVLRTASERAAGERDRADLGLRLARVLSKQGRHQEAVREFQRLLHFSAGLVDESGMPFAFYAAERLVDSGSLSDADRAAIVSALATASQRVEILPPIAWHQLRAITTTLAKTDDEWPDLRTLRAVVDRKIADSERALALQRDAHTLLAQWRTNDRAWIPYGDPMWLVGLGPRTGDGTRTVVAVRADVVASSIPARTGGGGFALAPSAGGGEWLGDAFPGVRVQFAGFNRDTSAERRLRRAFYSGALIIVLSVTLFGGYLLLRDVRRETALAELRSHFVSSVSHELKTPLTSIRMFAETLQLGRADPAAARDYLETIVNESERLTRLLNNVLDFSNMERGRKLYRREASSLPDVVQSAARAMAYDIAQHGCTLLVDIDDSLPPVLVDADAIEQAVLNLLSNAVKYSGNRRTIGLRLSRENGCAIIAIQDHGIGIPIGEQQRIFDKFYRVPSPENERVRGAGLGLSLVDHIVKAHQGTVHVDSAAGVGSTFSVRLPLQDLPVRGDVAEGGAPS